MKLDDLKGDLALIKANLSRILVKSGYWEEGDLDSLEYNRDNLEEAFLVSEFNDILRKISGAYSNLVYLGLPIQYEGKLHKQSNGRYCLGDCEITSGCGIEALVYDEWSEKYRWICSSVEHDGRDYYLVHQPDVSMEGLVARIRGGS